MDKDFRTEEQARRQAARLQAVATQSLRTDQIERVIEKRPKLKPLKVKRKTSNYR